MRCYRCESVAIKRRYSLNGFDIYTCSQCNLSKVYPTPDEPTLARYYSGQETNIAKGNVLHEIQAFQANPRQAISIMRDQRLTPLDRFGEQFRDLKATIVDVGCGGGTFLAALKHLGYKNLFGLEYNPESVKLIQEHLGICAFHGAIRAIPDIPPADIVTCFDVLEHVPEPQASFTELNHMLKTGGGLHIRVPNFGSLSSRLLGPRWLWAMPPYHLNYFTPAVLVEMVQQAGFESISVFTRGSGYRMAFLVLQLKKLISNAIDLPSPKSRAYSPSEFAIINSLEMALRILQSPVTCFCRLTNMDDCIHIVARKSQQAAC